ncbi:protein translocase subunit SecD [Campylobacter sp. RM15925]|uniref:protein translocase subunit SecD n=1 Tax=Campylobacter sp. RM15925 TaxID=1705724 RepID=UPI001472E616|nr:protein translocase subunit SecD [Campylobacter sp. RM15925]
MRSAKVTYRLVIFIIALVLGIGFSAPSFFKDMGGAKISLGLDLQGGLHMLLGVETEEAIHSKVKSIASSINYYAGKEDILIDNFKIRQDYVNFELLDSDDQRKIDDMLKEIKGLDVTKEALKYTIRLSDSEKAETIEYAINQAVETIRNRLDQFGLAEPTVARQGEEKILVELPGVKTQADEQRARELIAKAAHLQLMALDEKRQPQANTLSAVEAESYGSIVYPDVKNEQQKYVVKNIPVLDGSMLTDARVTFDQRTNAPVISFTLNAEGARIFGDFTGANVGKRLAIVLDGKVYSAPVINERIGGGNGQISGGFSVEEAHDVAIALRSGALLAPVKMLEKRSIGPSLGADSINQSMTALASAGVLVVLFMIVYYGFAGILANFALIANILILVAVMAMFGATLTLPGMAGVVLTIGMAVDANVIINERIREFLRDGHGIAASVKKGYENAMSAIIDANLTTLITSAVLYAYGTGPVKGFAVTMSIGILASMLTAILGTRGMFDALMNRIEKSGNTQIWFGYKRG